MTKRHVDEQITLTGTFKTDAGVLTDPTAVAFTYRIGRNGTEQSVTPTNPSTGVYTATFTPDEAGNIYGTFKGTGALIKTLPVHVPVFPSDGRLHN